MAVETVRKSFMTDVLVANNECQSSSDMVAPGGRLRSERAVASAVVGASRTSCASSACVAKAGGAKSRVMPVSKLRYVTMIPQSLALVRNELDLYKRCLPEAR